MEIEMRKVPFLLRFAEKEELVRERSLIATPEAGGESNPVEEEPTPEPTSPTPWGD